MNVKILERDMEIERGGSKVRETLRRFLVRGDYDGEENLVLWWKPQGQKGIDIRWSGFIGEWQKKDLRRQGDFYVYGHCNLTKRDMIKLANWLLRRAKE